MDLKLYSATLKFELEYFKQVIVEFESYDLSRVSFLREFIFPLRKNLSLALGLINQSHIENIFKNENNLFFANISFSNHLSWKF